MAEDDDYADLDDREWPEIPADISSQISEKQLRDMKKAFMLFDTDGNGTISKGELSEVMSSLGQESSDALIAMMNNADEDGDGNVDFLEFVIIMMKQIKSRDEELEIKEAFAVFSDGAEFIPFERITLILKNLGEVLDEAALNRMVLEADFDGDGKVGYKDFCLCMQNASKEEMATL